MLYDFLNRPNHFWYRRFLIAQTVVLTTIFKIKNRIESNDVLYFLQQNGKTKVIEVMHIQKTNHSMLMLCFSPPLYSQEKWEYSPLIQFTQRGHFLFFFLLRRSVRSKRGVTTFLRRVIYIYMSLIIINFFILFYYCYMIFCLIKDKCLAKCIILVVLLIRWQKTNVVVVVA